MSDALAQGLLGFAGGVAGTFSNEYENINKEKTAIRAEERDAARALEAERRKVLAEEIAEKRRQVLADASARDGRIHAGEIADAARRDADTIDRATFIDQEGIKQNNKWIEDGVENEQVLTGNDAAANRARVTREAELEADRNDEMKRIELGLPPRGGTTALAPVAGATEAKDAIHTQVTALINDQILESDEYTLLVNTKKNPRARLTGATSGEDIYKVFKDEENLPIIRAEIAGSMAPAINARVSKMVKNKTMTEEEMEATAIAIADSVDSVSAQWAKLGMNFDKNGNIPASVAARINQEIDRVVKSGGSREDAITALINNDLAAMREALGEYDNAYATLRKTMRPMLTQLYQWREPAAPGRGVDRPFGGPT